LPANFLLFGKISLALNDPPEANHPERRVIERQVLDRAINFRRELGVDVFNLQDTWFDTLAFPATTCRIVSTIVWESRWTRPQQWVGWMAHQLLLCLTSWYDLEKHEPIEDSS
jgi:hypothetical protein